MRKSRRRVLDNLFLAFGDAHSVSWRKKICRQLFKETVHNALEVIAWSKLGARAAEKKVKVTGEEILKEALKSGKGVVAVCAHLGNFPALQVRLLRLGFPINVVIRNATNPYLNSLWEKMMRRLGMRYIMKANLRRAIEDSRASLRQGDCLCIYLDQHAGNGVRVNFFGRPVLAPVGAAVLARKYNCPVIGIFTFRKDCGHHQVIIEGPYPVQRSENPDQDIINNTALFLSRVEHYVRQHPEQWFSWIHRRFR